MNTMETYSTLVESGRTLESDVSRPEVRQPLMSLLEMAETHDRLPLEGAWRLDSKVVRQLESREGYRPAGGWRGVASLAAGCDVLEAHREAFEPGMTLEELADWSVEETNRRLVEAFTRRLVPPTTAAGLFILLGIHPAWGVHLAHASNRCASEDVERSEGRSRRERDLFPDEAFRLVRRTVFDAIGAVLSTLRQLDAGRGVSVDALSTFVESVCRQLRCDADEACEDLSARGLEPFVDSSEVGLERSNWRVIDFTTEDLLDAFLVPAGAARHFDDGTFCVWPDVLEGVQVGPFDVDAQHERLNCLLADDRADSRVA